MLPIFVVIRGELKSLARQKEQIARNIDKKGFWFVLLLGLVFRSLLVVGMSLFRIARVAGCKIVVSLLGGSLKRFVLKKTRTVLTLTKKSRVVCPNRVPIFHRLGICFPEKSRTPGRKIEVSFARWGGFSRGGKSSAI